MSGLHDPPWGESDTRSKLIDPAIHARGWTEEHIRREETAGAIEIIDGKPRRRSKGRVDYTLRVKVSSGSQPVALDQQSKAPAKMRIAIIWLDLDSLLEGSKGLVNSVLGQQGAAARARSRHSLAAPQVEGDALSCLTTLFPQSPMLFVQKVSITQVHTLNRKGQSWNSSSKSPPIAPQRQSAGLGGAPSAISSNWTSAEHSDGGLDGCFQTPEQACALFTT